MYVSVDDGITGKMKVNYIYFLVEHTVFNFAPCVEYKKKKKVPISSLEKLLGEQDSAFTRQQISYLCRSYIGGQLRGRLKRLKSIKPET